MSETDLIYDGQMKYDGIALFKDLYLFCYEWLTEEIGFTIFTEKKYTEKLKGNAKDIEIKWEVEKEISDYFKFKMDVDFRILKLTEIEINKDGQKIKTNKGSMKIKAKGQLIRDYNGKFERTAMQKFWRSVYEKWIIPTRIDQVKEHIAGKTDEFLSQAKAHLALEGKR
jgi:hypothetical protein